MDLYKKVIAGGTDFQIQLTVSEWYEVEYLHIRKYYLDFEENWLPTKEGVSMPLDIENIANLFSALVELLADAESKEILEEHFKETLDELYKL